MSAEQFDEESAGAGQPADTGSAACTAARAYYCPQCREPLKRITGKLGPFWGCTAYPRCTGKMYDRNGSPATEPDARYRCPVCTRPLARASNERGEYWYCIGYNKGCKTTLADESGTPVRSFRCGSCGQVLKQRSGKNGIFWGCSRYPECRQSYADVEGRPSGGKRPPITDSERT